MGTKTTNYNWDIFNKGQRPYWDEWVTLMGSIDTELYKRTKDLYMQGKIIYGAEASGGDLLLKSTSHATKGKIYFGANAYFDEANERLNRLSVGGLFLDPRKHGVTFDNVTDDTDAWNDTLAEAEATGLAIMAPCGSSYIAGQLVLPNNGATPPKQRSIKIIGAGNFIQAMGSLTVPYGGTILRMTYAGGPKIQTTGIGVLEVYGCTLYDDTDGTQPFIYTTNTTLKIHDSTFWGKTQNTPVQDAIILGGITTGTGFQGYGTVIQDNYFNNIRKGVYGRVWANANLISGNTFWTGCGGGATDGAITFDGIAASLSYDMGNYIHSNTVEMANYVYGIFLDQSVNNLLLGNSFYDAGVTSLAAIRMDTNSSSEIIINGYVDPAILGLSAATENIGIYIPATQDLTSIFGSQNPLRVNAGITVSHSAGLEIVYPTNSDNMRIRPAASDTIYFFRTRLGKSEIPYLYLQGFYTVDELTTFDINPGNYWNAKFRFDSAGNMMLHSDAIYFKSWNGTNISYYSGGILNLIGDINFLTAGKGVILKNSAGTVTKRVRLNDDGDGLIFEAA